MSTKRKKPELVVPVPDVDAADRALAEIAGIERQLAAAEARLNEDIDAAKERARKLAAPLQERLAKLEGGLQAFGETHRADYFGDRKKSLELVHGFLGFRLSTSISVRKDTLELLRQQGRAKCIRVKETVDKDELAKLGDGDLAAVKAKRVVEDKFWYETKKEEIPASGERQAQGR